MRGFLILLILLGFPVLDIFSLVRLSEIIGGWWLAWVLASALLGWLLIRGEGMRMPLKLVGALQSGHSLSFALLDSFRTILAGLLLIFPGVASDLLAVILLLLPRPRAQTREAAPAANEEIIIEGEWRRENEQHKIGPH